MKNNNVFIFGRNYIKNNFLANILTEKNFNVHMISPPYHLTNNRKINFHFHPFFSLEHLSQILISVKPEYIVNLSSIKSIDELKEIETVYKVTKENFKDDIKIYNNFEINIFNSFYTAKNPIYFNNLNYYLLSNYYQKKHNLNISNSIFNTDEFIIKNIFKSIKRVKNNLDKDIHYQGYIDLDQKINIIHPYDICNINLFSMLNYNKINHMFKNKCKIDFKTLIDITFSLNGIYVYWKYDILKNCHYCFNHETKKKIFTFYNTSSNNYFNFFETDVSSSKVNNVTQTKYDIIDTINYYIKEL